jgi:hypothetical protein
MIHAGEEHRESIRDGREVHIDGGRVPHLRWGRPLDGMREPAGLSDRFRPAAERQSEGALARYLAENAASRRAAE